MASEVKLPRLGQGMEAGTIVKWLKSEGEVPVGETIAFIGEEGEQAPEPSGNGASAARQVDEDSQEEGSPGPAREAERERGRGASEQIDEARQRPTQDGGRVKASPLARRIARERGIELSALTGTGPEGRIVAEDVERAGVSAAPAAPAPAAAPGEVERRELTSIRKTIARRLTEAWQIPVFQLQVSVDMARANELVARLREHEDGPKATVTDVLTKVCAAGLLRHREVNAQYTDDAILLHPTANIGIAVAAPQGLVVPVIHGAERLRLTEIATARADIVSRAREGKLERGDLENGTFTISNLGMYSVERFTAVLNPPQAAIVAVGATEERAVALDGEVVVRPTMTITGTFDHRAVDGAPAADFLQTVKELLEEPALML